MAGLEVNYFCIRCMTSLTGKQEKFCSDKCGRKYRHKISNRKKWKEINAKAKTKKIEKKTRRKILIEQEAKRREELESKDICPACGSWDKDTRKDYDVIYKGIKGKCLNPICKAEWKIKVPN
jgi:hypothetical protein